MQEMAADLLEVLWRAVPNDYKSRYRRAIWEQFENTIRAAAYTNNLGKFVNSACLKLNAGIQAKDTQRAEEILNSGNDKALLKLFREETTLIVLMVRVRNQERQDEWKEKQAEKEAIETMSNEDFFAAVEGN